MDKEFLKLINLNNFTIDIEDDENTLLLYEQLIYDNNFNNIDEEA